MNSYGHTKTINLENPQINVKCPLTQNVVCFYFGVLCLITSIAYISEEDLMHIVTYLTCLKSCSMNDTLEP